MTTNTSAITTKIQRQPPPGSMPKAAPVLWMFTSSSIPGMMGMEPVLSAMFTVTQYLSPWSNIRTSTAAMA